MLLWEGEECEREGGGREDQGEAEEWEGTDNYYRYRGTSLLGIPLGEAKVSRLEMIAILYTFQCSFDQLKSPDQGGVVPIAGLSPLQGCPFTNIAVSQQNDSPTIFKSFTPVYYSCTMSLRQAQAWQRALVSFPCQFHM